MEESPDSLQRPSSVKRPREWHRASAREMRAELDSGAVSSRELTRAHLDRIAEIDPEIRAFTLVFRESAEASAERADDERVAGKHRGPLHGLPVSIEESFDFAGRATTLGLVGRKAGAAPADALMVRALSDAGAVVLGRTNVPQLLRSVESDNPLFGRTTNPFSPRHAAGGEAAAIGAGLSPLGFATDGRVAAHFCGVAALTATPGRLPHPHPSSLLARTVGDLELALDALPASAMSELDPRVPPLMDPPAPPLRGVTVGVLHDFGLLAPSSALIGALERAGDALRAAGARVEPCAPRDLDQLFFAAVELELTDGARSLIDALTGEPVAESLRSLHKLARIPRAVRAGLEKMARLAGDPETARVIAAIDEKSAGEHRALGERIGALGRAQLESWRSAGLTAILCPPYATPAVPHGQSADFAIALSYSLPWAAAGLPAGVVPVTRVHGAEARRDRVKGQLGRLARRIDEQSAGLPVGVQLVAPPWHERTLLSLMAAIERNVSGDVDYPRTPVW
ncbi:MAG: amidase [Myxococcales bacterium]|nr:amidase [Myxococcales bacterium]